MTNAFAPQTPIEQASMAIVWVHSGSIVRTGFFVSDDGYLVTHRDYMKSETVEIEIETDPKKLEEKKQNLRMAKRWLSNQEAKLQTTKEQLEQLQREAENETDPTLREQKQKDYEDAQSAFIRRQRFLVKKRSVYIDLEKEILASEAAMGGNDATAEEVNTYSIELKDGSIYRARVVATSVRYNLALLRVENCKSPFIEMLERSDTRPGMSVTVVADPRKLMAQNKHGAILGWAEEYVRTSASITHAESGGPLLADDGKWIGVAFYETNFPYQQGARVGYALVADEVMKEFGAFINQ